MDLRQLQHFVAVAEEQHFTRAARRANIVQSALSASIRSLEDELGAKLFVRSTRSVRLTTAGRVLLEKAGVVLDAARDARDSVARVAGLTRGRLSVGTVQSLPAFLDLPSILSRFHADHPGVDVRLCQGGALALLEKIRTGQVDLAFLPLCETSRDIATTMIACEPLVVACPPGHRLTGQNELSLAQLSHEPFVDFERDRGTRILVDRSFAAAGLERLIAFEVNDLDTLLDLVGRGLGFALVPEAVLRTRRSSLATAYLSDPEICWELVVAYSAGSKGDEGPADGATKAFLDLVQTREHWDDQ